MYLKHSIQLFHVVSNLDTNLTEKLLNRTEDTGDLTENIIN